MRSNPQIPLRGDRNECPSCAKVFRSSHAFDKHRVGYFSEPPNERKRGVNEPRRCMTEEEMRAAGMALNASGYWVGSLRDVEGEITNA